MIKDGLWYTYAAQKYEEFVKDSCSHYDACKQLSWMLVHERAEVTRVYLASIPAENTKVGTA